MKIGSLNKLFSELGKFLRARQDQEAASMIEDLRALFAGYDDKQLSVFSKKIGQWKTENVPGTPSPRLKKLQEFLGEFGSLLQLSGANAAAADTRTIATFVAGCGHPSVAAFVAEARSGVARGKATTPRQPKVRQPKVPKSGQPRPRKPPPPLRVDLVRTYADELTAASENNAAFDTVVAKIEADKKNVRVMEMLAIANRYLGYDLGRRKKRGAALQAIKDRQALDARHAAKKIADHMTKW